MSNRFVLWLVYGVAILLGLLPLSHHTHADPGDSPRDINKRISRKTAEIAQLENELSSLRKREESHFGGRECHACSPQRNPLCSPRVFERISGYSGLTSEEIGYRSKEAGGSCVVLYNAYEKRMDRLDSICRTEVETSDCGVIQKKHAIKTYRERITTARESLDALELQLAEALNRDDGSKSGDCAKCEPRRPGSGDYLIGTVQALTPIGLGLIGSGMYGLGLNAYGNGYSDYLNSTSMIGVPPSPPQFYSPNGLFPGVGMGNAFYGPGMGLGLNYGSPLMTGCLPGGVLGPGMGMGPGSGFPFGPGMGNGQFSPGFSTGGFGPGGWGNPMLGLAVQMAWQQQQQMQQLQLQQQYQMQMQRHYSMQQVQYQAMLAHRNAAIAQWQYQQSMMALSQMQGGWGNSYSGLGRFGIWAGLGFNLGLRI